MAVNIFLSQRTLRHVVKRLNASYTHDATFGTFGSPQTDNTGLNFPWGITLDSTNNVYVCDMNNMRIVKLNSSLAYVGNVDVATEIGIPHCVWYDTSDLYVVGVKNYTQLSIARITTGLSISKFNSNIGFAILDKPPRNITKGFNPSEFIISGLGALLSTTEGISFSTAVDVPIVGEPDVETRGHGMIDMNNIYVNIQRPKFSQLVKINNSYEAIGNSNIISKKSSFVSTGLSNSLLVFDNDNEKVLRYSTDLNLVETVYENTGSDVATDGSEIYGMAEADF